MPEPEEVIRASGRRSLYYAGHVGALVIAVLSFVGAMLVPRGLATLVTLVLCGLSFIGSGVGALAAGQSIVTFRAGFTIVRPILSGDDDASAKFEKFNARVYGTLLTLWGVVLLAFALMVQLSRV